MDPTSAKVAVLGSGPWALVLADLFAVNQEQVLLWGHDTEVLEAVQTRRKHPQLPRVTLSKRLRVVKTLAEVTSAPCLVLAVQPSRIRDTLHHLGDYTRGDHQVLCAARGLEAGTGLTLSEIVAHETCVKLIGTLAGPQLTLSVARGNPGGGVVASRYEGVARHFQALLSSPRYRVYSSGDVPGAEYGPVLASVFSFVVGVADGMDLGPGGMALVFSRAVVEASRLGVAAGARLESFSGMSFMGVFTGSTFAKTRHEYRLGVAVGKDPTLVKAHCEAFPEQSVLPWALSLYEKAASVKVPAPLIGAVIALLTGRMTPDELRYELMTRPVTDES